MNLSIYVVGSNPLPIVTVLAYDLGLVGCGEKKPDGQVQQRHIAFVFSDDTKPFVANIINWVKKKEIDIKKSGVPDAEASDTQDNAPVDTGAEASGTHKPSVVYTNIQVEALNVHNSKAVYDKVKGRLATIQGKEDVSSIFLSNTGGTKVMSVCTTMAVVNFALKKGIAVSEADVDPVEKKILFNNISNLTEIKNKSVSSELNTELGELIKLEDIIELYNYRIKGPEGEDPHVLPMFSYTLGCPEKTLEFGSAILSNKSCMRSRADFIKQFLNFKQHYEENNFIPEHFSKFAFVDNDDDIKGIKAIDAWDMLKFFSRDEVFFLSGKSCKYASNAFFSYYKAKSKKQHFINLLSKANIFDDNESMVITKKKLDFIMGAWFVEYIYAVIDCIHKEKNRNAQFQFVSKLKLKPDGADSDAAFEIDIVFRNGITTTFITCLASSDAKSAKRKALEVLANADSLGLRTQVIVVSFAGSQNKSKNSGSDGEEDNDDAGLFARFNTFPARQYKDMKPLYYEDVKNVEGTNGLKSKLEEILF